MQGKRQTALRSSNMSLCKQPMTQLTSYVPDRKRQTYYIRLQGLYRANKDQP